MSTLGRRALLHGGVATAALFTVSRPVQAQVQDAARASMARAAAALIAALEPSQAVVFPFGHDERMNWHYVPRSRAGLAFKDMRPAGRTAAHELMKASLSGVGHAKAVNVVRLEEVHAERDRRGGAAADGRGGDRTARTTSTPSGTTRRMTSAPTCSALTTSAATTTTREDDMTELTGVIPITATPFDAEGRVDEESIVTLVEFEAKWPSRGSGPAGRGAARNEETIWPS